MPQVTSFSLPSQDLSPPQLRVGFGQAHALSRHQEDQSSQGVKSQPSTDARPPPAHRGGKGGKPPGLSCVFPCLVVTGETVSRNEPTAAAPRGNLAVPGGERGSKPRCNGWGDAGRPPHTKPGYPLDPRFASARVGPATAHAPSGDRTLSVPSSRKHLSLSRLSGPGLWHGQQH